jgi:hypothetical protein
LGVLVKKSLNLISLSFIPLNFGGNENLGLVWKEGMEWNGMKMNENNNFKILFPSLVWEF